MRKQIHTCYYVRKLRERMFSVLLGAGFVVVVAMFFDWLTLPAAVGYLLGCLWGLVALYMPVTIEEDPNDNKPSGGAGA